MLASSQRKRRETWRKSRKAKCNPKKWD